MTDQFNIVLKKAIRKSRNYLYLCKDKKKLHREHLRLEQEKKKYFEPCDPELQYHPDYYIH